MTRLAVAGYDRGPGVALAGSDDWRGESALRWLGASGMHAVVVVPCISAAVVAVMRYLTIRLKVGFLSEQANRAIEPNYETVVELARILSNPSNTVAAAAAAKKQPRLSHR